MLAQLPPKYTHYISDNQFYEEALEPEIVYPGRFGNIS